MILPWPGERAAGEPSVAHSCGCRRCQWFQVGKISWVYSVIVWAFFHVRDLCLIYTWVIKEGNLDQINNLYLILQHGLREQQWCDWGIAKKVATYQGEYNRWERPGPFSYFIGPQLVEKRGLKGRMEVSISIKLGNKVQMFYWGGGHGF